MPIPLFTLTSRPPFQNYYYAQLDQRAAEFEELVIGYQLPGGGPVVVHVPFQEARRECVEAMKALLVQILQDAAVPAEQREEFLAEARDRVHQMSAQLQGSTQ